jgi:acyl carrier protein
MSAREITLEELRELLQESCMLSLPKEKIAEDLPLFGPGGLGLDSIDALQLTVALEQRYGVSVEDPQEARQAFSTLGTLQHWLTRKLEASSR